MEWVENELKKNDAYIQIKGLKWNNDYDIVPNFRKVLTESWSISYPSLKKDREEKLFIMTPEWRLFWVFPQTEIQLEFEWKVLSRFSKTIWKVATISWMFMDDIQIVWEMENIENEEFDEVNKLKEEYLYEFVSHLKNQISDSNISLANNTIMYDLDGRILKFLAKMFPASFWNNLKNYNEFMKYFSLVDNNDVNLARYSQKKSQWSTFSIFSQIKKDLKMWIKNTHLLHKD